MRNTTRILACLAAFSGMFYGLANEALSSDSTTRNIIVIGNKDLPFDSLSRNELREIFSCRKVMWNDNQKIEIAIPESNKIHQAFFQYCIREESTQYREYWKDDLLCRENCPGMMFRSEKSLLSHVALTKGAIGFISSYTEPAGVKVIKITDPY